MNVGSLSTLKNSDFEVVVTIRKETIKIVLLLGGEAGTDRKTYEAGRFILLESGYGTFLKVLSSLKTVVVKVTFYCRE